MRNERKRVPFNPAANSPNSSSSGDILLQAQDQGRSCKWLRFSRPLRVLSARRVCDVIPVLRAATDEAERGRYAVGYLCYEAAPAFDPVFQTNESGPIPLAWFGIYDQVATVDRMRFQVDELHCNWSPIPDRHAYHQAIRRIRDYIASGDTYQVNFTTRLTTPFHDSTETLFGNLLAHQPRGYSAYLHIDDHVLCSLSPELFFALSGDRITCRPMKGTAPRGVTNQQDRDRSAWLQSSEKNRAENVMIVDMVRNDLGRVARPGTVEVTGLCDVERYRTVFQMTSSVHAHTDAQIVDIFKALFPCASITGAPKVRTMEIIRELEVNPRGIYTGCIGFLAPNREAQFNVAIRTVHIDLTKKSATYGIGGGILWDSTPRDEYRECMTKALVLRPPPPALSLLETLLWMPDTGYNLLSEHLDRLEDSATYFDFALDREIVKRELLRHAESVEALPHRVKVLSDERGELRIISTPLVGAVFQNEPVSPERPTHITFSSHPVDSGNRFLYHKTSYRELYDDARASVPNADDVILWNTRGEVTETTIGNIVAKMDGHWVSPPVSSGLLNGCYRRRLLYERRIKEVVITKDELRKSESVYIINSVRGWVGAQLREPVSDEYRISNKECSND